MICFPNAKINLGLNVVEKRPDGYHNIETVFYPIPLKDALEIIPDEQTGFTQTGIPVEGTPENNLVIKALNVLKENYSVPDIHTYLHKAIPFGAGLGGGSADAAFMLKLLNEQFGLQIADEELEKEALKIGADCPFFIRNIPVFASGTGNIFEPIDLSLAGYHICLVKPDIHVSTPLAYSMITPAKPALSLKEVIIRPVEEWKENMVNDFEIPVFRKHTEIKYIKEALYTSGAIYASMSGSGSSVFGIFRHEPNLSGLFPEHLYWQAKLDK